MKGKVSVKDRVLLILEENKGATISGEALARALNVSRAAVWKAIKSLQEEGYEITAGTNRGYCLDSNSDVLSMQGIKSYMSTAPLADLYVFDTIDSTNNEAKRLAMNGALHGTCIVANHQSEGRGRLGRSFYAPAKSGIYLSIILRPKFDMSKATLLTTMAAVATADAISQVCGIDPDIKWVNDLYYMGKKICGILTEAVTNFETGLIDSIVIGIGINCAPPKEEIPSDLKGIIGFIPGSFSFYRNQLAAEVINHVLELFEDVETGEFIEEYKKRSLIIGKPITVYKNGSDGKPVKAQALDIDDCGCLIVQYDDGTKETLSGGEVSIRRA